MILSPADDFSSRTLAAVPGTLGKLEYIAQLRTKSGAYAHWGLSRTYGEATANQTVAGAHSDIYLEVLRTPLRILAQEIQQQAEARGLNVQEYVAMLRSTGERLIPARLRGGTRRHFNSVLQSLSALADAQARQHGRAA